MFSFPTLIQSNTWTIIGWLVAENCWYAKKAKINESKEAPTPIAPAIFLGILRKPSPLIKNPMSGNKGISEIIDRF